MKYIITETQAERLKVLRRKDEIWDLITFLFPYEYPCDFPDFEDFMSAIKEELFGTLSLDWFTYENEDYVWDMVINFFQNDLEYHYNSICNE